MSRRSAFTIAAVIGGVASMGMLGATSEITAATATPTTTVAATTAATTLTPTTIAIAGPTPRESERVASPIDIEKIRATSLPLRTMGVAVGLTIALLAIAGFVYGKLSSRIPTATAPKLVPAGAGPAVASPPSATATAPLPPPAPIPLPPPVIEDAEADTVMFEPPPTHQPPSVIATAASEPDDAELAEVVNPDPTGTAADPGDHRRG